jgi:hypothetical protein
MTDDFEACCRAIARIESAAERRRFAEGVRKGLAVVRAAKRAGLKVCAVSIEGVDLRIGEPEPAEPAAESQDSPALFRARAIPKTKVVL